MTKQKISQCVLILLLLLVGINHAITAQEEPLEFTFNNQIATNLILPIFESFDVTYERTVANKWAVGLAGAIYGDRIIDLSTQEGFDRRYDTNYEVMPFVRLYFQGAQNKSHFMELFGSISQVDETNRFLRTTNVQGFGVYELGVNGYTAGGLGMGYGYRFLLLENKLVLEAQFGVRTNFNTNFIILNGTLVRTGIKVGYRF